MYNRILKRPMFKRGGSSYEAQGTGITSPYDTPRKRYDAGTTREDINERRAALGEDPRSEMSYAAEGFSSLGNPYKDDGEAKTISEMLYEGATATRASRAEGKRLQQGAELANIESDEAQIIADELQQDKLEQIRLTGKFKGDEYLKKTPRDRQIIDEKNILSKTITDPYGFVATFLDRISTGTVDARFASGPADVIPTSLFTKTDGGGYGFEESSLTVDRVWWDPTRGLWLVFEDTTGDGKANGIAYESVNVEDSLKVFTGGEYTKKSKQSSENLADPEGEDKPKKVVKKYTQEDYEQSAKDTTEKIKERFTVKGDITQGVNPYKEAEDTAATELSQLQGWWNNQVKSKEWNKEIDNEG